LKIKMTYTALTVTQLREEGGTLLQKIATETALIEAAITALGAGTGALADGKIWIGAASNACAQKTLSGDATMTREGVITVAPKKPLDLSGVVTANETTGTAIKIATTSAPLALDTAGQSGIKSFFSTAATSDTTYGEYMRLDVTGAGVEAICGRSKTYLKIAGVANAHGRHDTLELEASAGSVTGIGTGHRANLVLPARALPAGGNYFGAMAEISIPASGSVAAVTKCACLQIGTTGGDATAEKTIKNAISFDTLSVGTGNMVVENADTTPDWTGCIRILVNGATRYLHYTTVEGSA
jgi:hypothetical protein